MSILCLYDTEMINDAGQTLASFFVLPSISCRTIECLNFISFSSLVKPPTAVLCSGCDCTQRTSDRECLHAAF